MTAEEYYKHIYRLAFIVRFQNRIRVHNENVAEHSFFVAAIILQLYDDYEFDLGKALELAVSHDIVEIDVNDITNDVTSKYPNLEAELHLAAREEICKYPHSVYYGFLEYEEQKTIEARIAKLADIIQVRQYVMLEQSLGNSTFPDILAAIRRREWASKQELRKHERDNGTNS